MKHAAQWERKLKGNEENELVVTNCENCESFGYATDVVRLSEKRINWNRSFGKRNRSFRKKESKLYVGWKILSAFYLKTFELKAEKFQKFHNFEALFVGEESQNMNSLGLQNLSFKGGNIFADAFVSFPTGHKFEKRGRFPTDLISELQLLIIIVSGNSSAFATMNRNEGEFKFVISPFFSLAFFTTRCHFNESDNKN